MTQFALPMTMAGSRDPASIVLTEGNRAIAEALTRPQDWPFSTAVLTGPPRSGKSLLARWFEGRGLGEALDQADSVDETALFHRWNRAQEDGQPLLLVIGATSWDISLPDLASRMGAALQLEIGPLGDDDAAALILAHAAQRGLALGEDAPGYLVPRMERSHAAIERVVAEIDRLSLERKTPATLSLWRDALEAVEGPEQGRLL